MKSEPLIPGGWVLLNYRIPRVPSSPRVAVWRRLQALGVAQLGDGLVALPADARTREHFDWIAGDITDHGGTAAVWLGQPASKALERSIAEAMAQERRQEYLALADDAREALWLEEAARVRTAKRLRAQLRKINRRDYFPPPERALAAEAIAGVLAPRDTLTENTAAAERVPARGTR
ncbi:Chromate resistance protein ChrB [Arthrobacter sp. MMS18-M83]|uniref:Chromate resistance protein ChrB n=1 Tax=Arthrobacter sp. MMS18-M83 TaxID=2996261 RepID=UPI00227C8A4F|nr:Chromate resistance protein ChrB [Arthrobacter sp. MMS18-M83]WAH95286.1 chromate resistance protein [Arthrobacter sp. MMS18-M83]